MAKIAIVMGSISDWEQVQPATVIFDTLNIEYSKAIISAHRMPDEMFEFAKNARKQGVEVIIACAGGAAHLPGMIASQTTLPVIGVPIQSKALSGIDSLLSIVQMPAGVPVATMSIGTSGAKNAALYALRILSIYDDDIAQKLLMYQEEQKRLAQESNEGLHD